MRRVADTGNWGNDGGMRRGWLALLLLLGACNSAPADQFAAPAWSRDQIASLRQWAAAAPNEGLPEFSTTALDSAGSGWDNGAANRAATSLALTLANAHLHGCANAVERGGWRIPDDPRDDDVESKLREALTSAQDLNGFFASVKPQHPEYAALQTAFSNETDPNRRITLARNLERWRWMPRDLGQNYVLVNTAAFEVGLWKGGEQVKVWPGVVGKPGTPTPVFASIITHVILNPWWEVPPSIVDESGGNLSAAKGFVRTSSGRWRQKPGPGNSLGKMKLAMANPYNIYLHDTPAKGLFGQASRAYSHGCVRVGDALGFASTLLEGAMSRRQVDALAGVAKPDPTAPRLAFAGLAAEQPEELKSSTVALPANLQVYIAYFTAGTRGDGTFRIENDVYGRDMLIADPTDHRRSCSL